MPTPPLYSTDDDTNPKTLLGSLKPSLSSVPATALFYLAMAMMDGERKYGLHNWREKNVPARIYIDAAYRHLASWQDGEEYAADSGVHHLGHVMACCAILLDAQEQDVLIDDRPIVGMTSELLARLSEELKERQSARAKEAAPAPSPDLARLDYSERARSEYIPF